MRISSIIGALSLNCKEIKMQVMTIIGILLALFTASVVVFAAWALLKDHFANKKNEFACAAGDAVYGARYRSGD
jgi:hypothetical protein